MQVLDITGGQMELFFHGMIHISIKVHMIFPIAEFTTEMYTILEPSHLLVDHKIFERVSKDGGFVKRFPLKGASVMQ